MVRNQGATRIKRELSTVLIGTFVMPIFLLLLFVAAIFSTMAQKFVVLVAKILRPDLAHPLDTTDIGYAIDYIYNGESKVNIVGHFICDGQIQLDYLREQFHHRIISHCDPHGNLKYRKLRQIWTQFCGYMFWKWDPNFDLNNHVRLYDYSEPELAISSPCTEEDLKRVTGSLIPKPFLTPCPWEMLLIPEYRYVDDSDGTSRTGSVLILKIHHGIADGFSIFKLLNQLLDIRLKTFPTASFPQLSPLRKLKRMGVLVMKFPFDIAHFLVNSHDDPSSWHIVDQKLSRRYFTFYSDRIPMATIKTIKNKHGVGYNTTVYSIAAGAVSRLIKEAGQEVPKSMLVGIPYPLPNHPDVLVNHAALSLFTFSPSTQVPAVRLREIASQIKDPASLPTRPIALNWLGKMLGKLPVPALRRLLSGGSHASMVMSSYPMYEGPVEIMEGVRIRDIIPASGHPPGTMGTSVCCLTGAGNLRIVLSVDQLIFQGYPIPQNFNKLVQQEMDGLLWDQPEQTAPVPDSMPAKVIVGHQ